MIKIKSEVAAKIVKLKELNSYIAVVVDYKKEEEYSNLQEEVFKEVEKIFADNFEIYTNRDIAGIIDAIEDINEYYLYSSDDIIETLFPANTKKDQLIKSAYYWIEEKSRIEWIINNVLEVPSSKKYYGIVENINDNYILSTIEL